MRNFHSRNRSCKSVEHLEESDIWYRFLPLGRIPQCTGRKRLVFFCWIHFLMTDSNWLHHVQGKESITWSCEARSEFSRCQQGHLWTLTGSTRLFPRRDPGGCPLVRLGPLSGDVHYYAQSETQCGCWITDITHVTGAST